MTTRTILQLQKIVADSTYLLKQRRAIGALNQFNARSVRHAWMTNAESAAWCDASDAESSIACAVDDLALAVKLYLSAANNVRRARSQP